MLAEIGLESLSVTVNGVTPEVVSAMQPRLVRQGKVTSGLEAGTLLLERQVRGIARAVELGMSIKINTVVAPGINDHQVVEVAKRMAALGALVFNPMPLIPRAGFASLRAPDEYLMNTLRISCAPYLHVFAKCKQCRADACGIPGKE
jgi:nitrogen fixation protein NifB